MFKLQPNPVHPSVPGKEKPAAIKVHFKHLSRPEIKRYFEGIGGKQDAEALGEIITGWEDIDTPFSQGSLQQLLDNYPASGFELFEAFRRDLMEARQKN